MSSSDTKHDQSDATFGTRGRSPKARDIEAFAMSNLHGDPMMQLASSSIRSAGRRAVQRWGGIARRLANFGRWSLGGMGLLPPR
jgi:hypothetical protein